MSLKVSELSRPFTLLDDCDKENPLFKEIMDNDLKGGDGDTPLKLMKRYADAIDKGTNYGDIARKLDLLFMCGKTPETLNGFYHGITLGLKTGVDGHNLLKDILVKLGIDKENVDPLQVFYGRLLSKTSPWAGKNFKKLAGEKVSELTGGFDKGDKTSYLGINSFRKDSKGIVNNLSLRVLTEFMDLKETSKPERKQRSWISAKGGLFIAGEQKSVDPAHKGKKVVALNYRWKELGNKLPNRLLVDEIVEIAQGLYLGKLYYSTALEHILKDYDPQVNVSDYKYRNFGYFLLMDDTWQNEKNELFPELAYALADDLPEKFETFTLLDSPESKKIQDSLGAGMTVLHYLQDISMGVEEGAESEAIYFKKLNELFVCGQRPDGISGFLHGGVVAFKKAGLLKKITVNLLNELWPVARPFSPWTGKTFAKSSLEEIKKYIGDDADHYKGVEPIILGANTYRKDPDLSLPATVFIEELDKIGMDVEYLDEENKYIQVKSFFFIASNGKSIMPDCNKKEVLHFNYRWPELHMMPPDNLCIDELVRIADGLYIGQLLYSTKPLIKYDPGADPAIYKYENFGYFLLMDDEWFAIKEFIAFDTEA